MSVRLTAFQNMADVIIIESNLKAQTSSNHQLNNALHYVCITTMYIELRSLSMEENGIFTDF